MAKHQYTSENQPKNRGKRGPDKRTLILKAIKESTGHDEVEFYKALIARAMNPEDSASPTLLKEVLSRLYPSSKPTMPIVEFNYPSNGTATEKAEAIEQAVSDGILPLDMAKMMTDIIQSGLNISEQTELRDRIEALEALLNANSAQAD